MKWKSEIWISAGWQWLFGGLGSVQSLSGEEERASVPTYWEPERRFSPAMVLAAAVHRVESDHCVVQELARHRRKTVSGNKWKRNRHFRVDYCVRRRFAQTGNTTERNSDRLTKTGTVTIGRYYRRLVSPPPLRLVSIHCWLVCRSGGMLCCRMKGSGYSLEEKHSSIDLFERAVTPQPDATLNPQWQNYSTKIFLTSRWCLVVGRIFTSSYFFKSETRATWLGQVSN